MKKAPSQVLFNIIYRGDFMDFFEEYKKANPKRRVIFMNGQGSGYDEEYIAFNHEILTEALPKSSIDFIPLNNSVLIQDIDARKLLFECGILALDAPEQGGVLLTPSCSACDLMSACARIISKFKK